MRPPRRPSAAGFADLRLAVVSPFVDRRHGTERAMAELLERLARNYGCEIHLYAQRVADLHLDDSKSPRPAASGATFWHKVPRIPGPHALQFLAWLFLNGFLRKWHAFRGLRCDLLFSPGINCLHPDVVIVHALFHRLRDLAAETGKDPGMRGGIFRRWHRRVYYGMLTFLERRTYTNKRVRLAAVSSRIGWLMKDYFGRNDVSIIPNGVDAAHFSPQARLGQRAAARSRRSFRDEDFVLLLIGNDWRVKGLPAILHAMAALSALPLRLLVVGDDSSAYFSAQAAELGVQDRCRFEPPGKDVLDFYAAADIYVSPSLEDSFGLPVAEAMACGLPVITSAFAGVSEFVRDGSDGFVMNDPRDTEALAAKIRDLYNRRGEQSVSSPATANAQPLWTWDQNAAAFSTLLQSSVGQRQG